MPLLRRVARSETQSESGPAVARPMKAPTRTAKLVKPVRVIVRGREDASDDIAVLTNALGTPEVRWCGEGLGLGQIEGQEGAAAPGDDEAGEFDNGEGKKLPWNPQIQKDAHEWVRVWRVDAPLRLAGTAATEPWIFCCWRRLEHMLWLLGLGYLSLLEVGCRGSLFVQDLVALLARIERVLLVIWMYSVPFCLGEHEKNHDEREA